MESTLGRGCNCEGLPAFCGLDSFSNEGGDCSLLAPKTQAHWLVAFFLEILLHHAEEVLELEVLKVADRSQ
jgi:hypothetical protein